MGQKNDFHGMSYVQFSVWNGLILMYKSTIAIWPSGMVLIDKTPKHATSGQIKS